MKSRQAERLAKQKLVEITSSPELFSVSKHLVFNNGFLPPECSIASSLSILLAVLINLSLFSRGTVIPGKSLQILTAVSTSLWTGMLIRFHENTKGKGIFTCCFLNKLNHNSRNCRSF